MDEVRKDADGTLRNIDYCFFAYGMSGVEGYVEIVFSPEESEKLLALLSKTYPGVDPMTSLKRLKENELTFLAEMNDVRYSRNEGAE